MDIKNLSTFVIQAFKSVLDKYLGVNIASPTINIWRVLGVVVCGGQMNVIRQERLREHVGSAVLVGKLIKMLLFISEGAPFTLISIFSAIE